VSAQTKTSTFLPFMSMATKRDLCARTLAQRKLPVKNRLGSGDFDPTSNKIKVMTMKVSKGLEFPVVALPGVGLMPGPGEDEKDAARVFYVAATRATQRLVMGGWGWGIWEAIAPCAITSLAPFDSILWNSETCPR
jgi:superfamily I DNA/RNA helicase